MQGVSAKKAKSQGGNKISNRKMDQLIGSQEDKLRYKLAFLRKGQGVKNLLNHPSVGGQVYSKVQYGIGSGSMVANNQGTTMMFEKTEAYKAVTSSATSGAYDAGGAIFHAMSNGLNWLGNMANAFTSYELLKVEFTYVPAVPTTTAGAFTFAFLEDIRDDIPATMTQMLATEQALYAPVYAGGEGGTFLQQFGAPSGNVISFQLPKHVISNSDGSPKRFRVTKDATLIAAAAASDAGAYSAEAYTPGRLVWATAGITATNATVGQIFVRYRIRLSGAIAFGNQQ